MRSGSKRHVSFSQAPADTNESLGSRFLWAETDYCIDKIIDRHIISTNSHDWRQPWNKATCMYTSVVFVEQEWLELKSKLADELYKAILCHYKVMDRSTGLEIISELRDWLGDVVNRHFPEAPAQQPFAGHVMFSDVEWSGVPIELAKAMSTTFQQQTRLLQRDDGLESVRQIEDVLYWMVFMSIKLAEQALTAKYHPSR